MSDTLLPYYESELAAIRELAADFARAHPRVAEGLRLSPDSVADPHVERLLEGVAFLAARVQHRLDDELPELTDEMLARAEVRKGGRPPSPNPRKQLTLRLPADVIERWKATGPGWQTRMAERLAKVR